MIRNRHRVGTHLVTDEETGFVHYSDEMVRRWDGAVVHWKNDEQRHPQEFVKVRKEAAVKGLVSIEVATTVLVTADLQPLTYIGTTSIPTRTTIGNRTYK